MNIPNVINNEKFIPDETSMNGPNRTPAEGLVMDVGSKMFAIAGPVPVYGVIAGVACVWSDLLDNNLDLRKARRYGELFVIFNYC